MAHWLFKTEPSEYSYADLVRDKRAVWEGVANATALIHLRKIVPGDIVVVYHTGNEKSAVALASIKRGAYPGPKLQDPKRVVVDLVPTKPFAKPVPLATFKADELLATTDLVRLSRLSVVPLTSEHFARILKLSGTSA
jgi:predicted RNA-binding protein with PUA-like domain